MESGIRSLQYNTNKKFNTNNNGGDCPSDRDTFLLFEIFVLLGFDIEGSLYWAAINQLPYDPTDEVLDASILAANFGKSAHLLCRKDVLLRYISRTVFAHKYHGTYIIGPQKQVDKSRKIEIAVRSYRLRY